MKQSHVLRCEVAALRCSGNGVVDCISTWIAEETQKRLDRGWTLRAAPVVDSVIYLIFVRKEAKRSSP